MPELAVYIGIVAVAALAVYLLARVASGGNKSSSATLRAAPKQLGYYSMEEVQKHNTEDDMWIVVKYENEQRVYDITEYCDMHPGGDVIYDSAGKDATAKFNGPQHPPTVHDLIREYHIGWVGKKPTGDEEKKDN
jgi:cytochrome b involved in lipid metabolism